MKPVAEFERVRTLLTQQSTASASDSALSQYEKRLKALRQTLRQERHEYPLGAILVSIGAITDRELNRALSAQHHSKQERLLGELLVEMGLIHNKQLTHALAIQHAASSLQDSNNNNPFGGASN